MTVLVYLLLIAATPVVAYGLGVLLEDTVVGRTLAVLFPGPEDES